MPDETLFEETKPEVAVEITPIAETSVEDSKLIITLRKERDARAKAESQVKEATTRESQLQAKLDKYKEVDPDRYAQLQELERQRQEQDLIRKQEYETLKTQAKTETEKYKQEAERTKGQLDNLIIKTAFESAFYTQGGQRPLTGALEGEIASPVGTALSYLKDRIRLKDGEIVVTDPAGQIEINKEGKPKTIAEKLEELKQTSWGFLFMPENNASGSGMLSSYGAPPTGARVYSAESARQGRASIDDIAAGKAQVI